MIQTTTQAIRYHGATKDQKVEFLGQVNRRRVEVSTDRNFEMRHWTAANLDELPKHGYAAYNWQYRVSTLVVDIDAKYEQDRIQSFGIIPNWIGINQENSHAQLIYYLSTPVFGEGKAKAFYRHVSSTLNLALDGDPHFSRDMARNPLHSTGCYEWHFQHAITSELRELYDAVDEEVRGQLVHSPQLGAPTRIRLSFDDGDLPTDEDGLMRETILFTIASQFAYQARYRGETLTFESMIGILNQINRKIAELDPRGGLKQGQLKSTARSIVKWTNANLRPGVKGKAQGGYTLAQRSAGGRIQGPRNVESGQILVAQKLSSAALTEKKLTQQERIRNAHYTARLNGLAQPTNEELASQFNCSVRTVQRAFPAPRTASNRDSTSPRSTIRE